MPEAETNSLRTRKPPSHCSEWWLANSETKAHTYSSSDPPRTALLHFQIENLLSCFGKPPSAISLQIAAKAVCAQKSVIFLFLEEDASAAMVGQIYGYSKQKAIDENAVRHFFYG